MEIHANYIKSLLTFHYSAIGFSGCSYFFIFIRSPTYQSGFARTSWPTATASLIEFIVLDVLVASKVDWHSFW